MNAEQSVATPTLIKILSILLLLAGLLWILLGVGAFLLVGPIPAVSAGVMLGALLVVAAVGLRKMKMWALYLYTTWIILQGANTSYSIAIMPDGSDQTVGFLGIALGVAILIYLWMQKKSFR